MALVLADLDDRVEGAGIEAVGDGGFEARGSDADEEALDLEEAAAAAAVRSALLECAMDLMGGDGRDGGEVEERKARKALMKAVGKKVEKKHRGNRAEALAVVRSGS